MGKIIDSIFAQFNDKIIDVARKAGIVFTHDVIIAIRILLIKQIEWIIRAPPKDASSRIGGAAERRGGIFGISQGVGPGQFGQTMGFIDQEKISPDWMRPVYSRSRRAAKSSKCTLKRKAYLAPGGNIVDLFMTISGSPRRVAARMIKDQARAMNGFADDADRQRLIGAAITVATALFLMAVAPRFLIAARRGSRRSRSTAPRWPGLSPGSCCGCSG